MKKAIATVLAATLTAFCARAATLTVTSIADSGPGSLRNAIAAAASGDTVAFGVTGAITLTTGELLIAKNLTIAGPGAASLTIQRSAATGTPSFRIFNVRSGIVSISGLTLSNGDADPGGGINNNATLTLQDC